MPTRYECPFCYTVISPDSETHQREDVTRTLVGGQKKDGVWHAIVARIDHGTKQSVRCPGCHRDLFTLQKITTN